MQEKEREKLDYILKRIWKVQQNFNAMSEYQYYRLFKKLKVKRIVLN